MWGERVFALHLIKETNKMNDFAFAILLLVLAISLHLTIGRRT